ncbi:hypothetical protein C1H46_006778 [Malus baccata]|uniref:Uncharacterized protein n=1 Tax=Malus baccata TaxID=106549 RepID=A0A540N9D5_MALBA|nr:hypothetical protein C1H46_006778 [Malus baccata]
MVAAVTVKPWEGVRIHEWVFSTCLSVGMLALLGMRVLLTNLSTLIPVADFFHVAFGIELDISEGLVLDEPMLRFVFAAMMKKLVHVASVLDGLYNDMLGLVLDNASVGSALYGLKWPSQCTNMLSVSSCGGDEEVCPSFDG